MSSDTAKENASVVDSSATEWKNDMGNFDDSESPIYKGQEDSYPLRAEKEGLDQLENSSLNKSGKLYNTRYFIIKSLNHQNLQLSVEKGIWATQVMNEPILEEAFHNSNRVILIFSVNMSGFFQGYAQMMSSVGWRRDDIWSQGFGKSNPWGRSFKVRWLRLNNLPFQKTLHLKNPLNDYKPVKISRDCQELPEDVGEALCELIDGEGDIDGLHNRDDLPLKRPCIDPPCTLGDGEYNIPSLHMSWVRTSMPYPSFLYQHQAEASRFNLAQQGGVNFPHASSALKASGMKPSQLNGSLANLRVKCDLHSRTDAWGLSAESPLASSLTEEDFLEMTYEEYLEVHRRSVKQLKLPVVGSSRTNHEQSRSKDRDDDLNSSFVSDQCRSRKRTHHSSDN